jgi:hypothetical protein
MFQTLTLAYDASEDRIIVATDLGEPSSWACWLTRRMALTFLTRACAYVDKTSPLVSKASAYHRRDVVEFEKSAALHLTACATTSTDHEALNRCKATAELAATISISSEASLFRLELRGNKGGFALGELGRPLFQRIMHVLNEEAERAGWMIAANPAASDAFGEVGAAGLVRH